MQTTQQQQRRRNDSSGDNVVAVVPGRLAVADRELGGGFLEHLGDPL